MHCNWHTRSERAPQVLSTNGCDHKTPIPTSSEVFEHRLTRYTQLYRVLQVKFTERIKLTRKLAKLQKQLAATQEAGRPAGPLQQQIAAAEDDLQVCCWRPALLSPAAGCSAARGASRIAVALPFSFWHRRCCVVSQLTMEVGLLQRRDFIRNKQL